MNELINNLEESFAAFARAHSVVLADGVIPADSTQTVLACRRAHRLGLRQSGLDGRRQGAASARGRGRVRRRRQAELAHGRRHVAAGRGSGAAWSSRSRRGLE